MILNMERIFTIDKLKEELERTRIPKSYYRIGSYGEEALCILIENNKWIVFEGERGQRYNAHFFDSEQDACLYFRERIKVFL